jgi:hypothetical protein
LTGRGTDFALAEFTLESKLNLISFGLSIGLGGKPS